MDIAHTLKVQAAKQAGYSDAYYDGLYAPESLDCKCDECLAAYDAGQQEAVDKIFATRGVINAS